MLIFYSIHILSHPYTAAPSFILIFILSYVIGQIFKLRYWEVMSQRTDIFCVTVICKVMFRTAASIEKLFLFPILYATVSWKSLFWTCNRKKKSHQNCQYLQLEYTAQHSIPQYQTRSNQHIGYRVFAIIEFSSQLFIKLQGGYTIEASVPRQIDQIDEK